MLTQDKLKEFLLYEQNTGVFTWLTSNRLGKVAGSFKDKKRVRIRIGERWYSAHRLAWLYVYGIFPKDILDHIDGDPHNNRIDNLRECNFFNNAHNVHKLRNDNSSGFKGVSYDKKYNKWLAQIRVFGVKHYLGLHDSALDASKAYEDFAKLHHGDFYNATSIGNSLDASKR